MVKDVLELKGRERRGGGGEYEPATRGCVRARLRALTLTSKWAMGSAAECMEFTPAQMSVNMERMRFSEYWICSRFIIATTLSDTRQGESAEEVVRWQDRGDSDASGRAARRSARLNVRDTHPGSTP